MTDKELAEKCLETIRRIQAEIDKLKEELARKGYGS